MLRSPADIVAVDLDAIPSFLKSLGRWVIWKPEPSRDNPSALTKSPYHCRVTTSRASHSEPMSWSDFATATVAYQAREENGAGGIMVALGDGLAGVDLDDAIDPATGMPTPAAQRIIDRLASYTELSVSGSGVRIFVRAPEEPGRKFSGVEIYSRARFLTVTGRRLPGSPETIEDRTVELARLRDELEQARRACRPPRPPRCADDLPVNELFPGVTALRIPDGEIIVRARDVCGERFEKLWAGDSSGYDNDESRADLALAGFLAFMCGPGEHERVESLMRQSGLVRPKWDRNDYLPSRTIPRAYEDREDFYHWQVVPGVGRRSTQQAAAGHGQPLAGGPEPEPGPESQGEATAAAEQEGTPSAGGAENGAADDGGPVLPPLGMARPTIVIGPETDAILTELEGHMSELVFERNDELVQILKHEGGGPRGCKRQQGAAVIRAASVEQIQRLMSRHVRFVKLEMEEEKGNEEHSSGDSSGSSSGDGDGQRVQRQRRRKYRQIAAPRNLAQLFAKCGNWQHVPHLSGLATSPFMREDGTVVWKPGHDSESGYFLVDSGTQWLRVPDDPTAADVAEAVALLQDLIADFPFAGPEHLSAWVATLLTVVARPAIIGPVPMLWIDANRAGTGKTKLGCLIGKITGGDNPTELSWTSDEQEMENRITSLLLGGDPMAIFDNATGGLKNPTLERFLTCSEFGARKFFGQQLLKLPNRTTLVVTGNNLTPRGDLGRRVIRCRLETKLEKPEARSDFRHIDLEAYTLENRPALLAAALTILRAHAVAGFAPCTVPTQGADGTVTERPATPVGSFDNWNRVVRHAVLRAGFADPVATQHVFMEEDEDSVKLEALLREWHSASGNIAWTSTRLLEATFGLSGRGEPLPLREQLAAAIWEITDTAPGRMPETRLLGYKLRDAVDKTVGGYCLRREKKSNSGVRYVIECQDPACASCRRRSTREATS